VTDQSGDSGFARVGLRDQIDGDLQDGLALVLGVAFHVLEGEHPGVHREQRAHAPDLVDSAASGSLMMASIPSMRSLKRLADAQLPDRRLVLLHEAEEGGRAVERLAVAA
jgi:hypothetical protein